MLNVHHLSILKAGSKSLGFLSVLTLPPQSRHQGKLSGNSLLPEGDVPLGLGDVSHFHVAVHVGKNTGTRRSLPLGFT